MLIAEVLNCASAVTIVRNVLIALASLAPIWEWYAATDGLLFAPRNKIGDFDTVDNDLINWIRRLDEHSEDDFVKSVLLSLVRVGNCDLRLRQRRFICCECEGSHFPAAHDRRQTVRQLHGICVVRQYNAGVYIGESNRVASAEKYTTVGLIPNVIHGGKEDSIVGG